jgi:hypothetical protein
MTGRPHRTKLVALALIAALGLAGGACGDEPQEIAAPALVPEGLVPVSVQGDSLAFYETEAPGAIRAFADAGPDSLAADGRLWELRIGDRLIGVLQVTTLLPEIDLHKESHRDSIVRQLLPTARDRLDIGDVAVWTSTSSGKTSFLWFGKGMFSLLTVKPGTDDAIEPEAVLQDVLDHMVASDGWEYVYFEDEAEEA